MAEILESEERPQSFGEEIANSISHGIGFLAALIAGPILVTAALGRGSVAEVIGASVFAFTTMLLYFTSSLYHALRRSRAKQVFQVLDHAAIFLLIAGTYTPFTLGVLSGTWGWVQLGLVWGFALAGVVLKAVSGMRYPRLSTFLYLAMGWLGVFMLPLWLQVPAWGLFWLLAGGISYTVGVAFFANGERVRYNHFVWHLFVIAGTACHFVAVLRYSA